MSIAQTIALNWRAITAFVMAAVSLAVTMGWLPAGSEERAQAFIVSSQGLIAIIAGGSYVQNIATSKTITAQAGAIEQSTRAVAEVAQAQPSEGIAGAAAMMTGMAASMSAQAGKVPK